MRAGASADFEVLAGEPGGDAAVTVAERSYGGPLRFPSTPKPYVFANFVTSIDGVASLGLSDGTDSSTIGARSAADRFLMAMLRAASDAVLVGAGTLRTTPGHRWTPAALIPQLADELAEYRAALGGSGEPVLAVVSSSGSLPDHAALREPGGRVLLITTAQAAAEVAQLPSGVRTVSVRESGEISGSDILNALAGELGAGHVLCEGGPTLMGTLLRSRAVHELFLTLSPRIAGRTREDRRPGPVEGWAAAADRLLEASLLSLRRSGDHLFLRYRLAE
jgi:riboflavin biosynthesis pyrimidine reductase